MELTLQDLGVLPVRATVAFAARCARRVLPFLTHAPEANSASELAIRAIELAEAFARGSGQTHQAQEIADDAYGAGQGLMTNISSGSRGYAAYAAGHAANSVAHWTQGAATNTASMGQEVVAAAYGTYRIILSYNKALLLLEPDKAQDILLLVESDYIKLRDSNLGEFGQLGELVECSEKGPMGTLWPDPDLAWDFTDS